MMRIQVYESAQECLLLVEGEIEGLAANELHSFWRSLRCSAATAVIVDFSKVVFIDRKARSLLKSMHESGVRFTGARLAIQDTLDEITSRKDVP